MERWATAPISQPGIMNPAVVRFFARVIHPMMRVLHRATLEGIEHLPREGPFLLVANHPCGFGVAEIASFMALYAKHVGLARPLAGFAHPAAFSVPPISTLYRSIGTIPSTHEAADVALSAGVPILVLPGGDHEALRPFWQAHRVDFGGRVGFLRIAERARVPVVPMGFRSITVQPLFRSRVLAWASVWPRFLGVKRWGLSLFGVLGAASLVAFAPFTLPWRFLCAAIWALSPLAMLPCLPSRIRIRIGQPIQPDTLFTESGDLDGARTRVERAVEALLE